LGVNLSQEIKLPIVQASIWEGRISRHPCQLVQAQELILKDFIQKISMMKKEFRTTFLLKICGSKIAKMIWTINSWGLVAE
jgi:hypothetical protein